MTAKEMRTAFPESELWQERYFGLIKSFVAYSGFGEPVDEIHRTFQQNDPFSSTATRFNT